MPCSHIETCELFPELTVNGALKVWQIFYCWGDFSQCVRYQRSQEGQAIPITLLPNGKSMDASLLSKHKEGKKSASSCPATQETQATPAPTSIVKSATGTNAVSASTGLNGKDVESFFNVRIKASKQSDVAQRARQILEEMKIHIEATVHKSIDNENEWLILTTDRTLEMNVYRAIIRIEELPHVSEKVKMKCIVPETLPQDLAG